MRQRRLALSVCSAALLLLGLAGCEEVEDQGGPADDGISSAESEVRAEACRERCGEAVAAAVEACRERGGNRERCRAVAQQAAERCRNTCGERLRPDVDLRPGHCVQGCALRTARAIRACIAEGNEPRACAERAGRNGQACVAECREDRPERPDRPDDRDPPAGEDRCAERCRAQAEDVGSRCIEAGGEPERCRHRAREHARACFEDHCQPEDRPADCEGACAERARHFVAGCIETHGDEEACAARGRHHFAACVERHCAEEPAPEPPSCEEACGARGRHVHRECIENGGRPAACEERARNFVGTCIEERCGGAEPEPPSCEEACGARGRQLNRECIENGGRPAACEERARHFVGTCIEERCGDGDEEAPSCEEACAARGAHTARACVEEHGEEFAAECRARGAYVTRECIASHCGEPEQPPACEDRCAAHAREFFERCSAEHDEDACAERTRAGLEQCVATCDGAEPPPPPRDREGDGREPPPPPRDGDRPGCADRCEAMVGEHVAACTEATGDAAACERRFAPVLERCLAACE